MKDKELTLKEYNSYMKVVNRFLKEMEVKIRRIPEYEKMSKLTFEEWKEFINRKNNGHSR